MSHRIGTAGSRIKAIIESRTAQSLALHTRTVLRGALIVEKAKDDADIAAVSGNRLRRYVELLFRSIIHRGKEIA